MKLLSCFWLLARFWLLFWLYSSSIMISWSEPGWDDFSEDFCLLEEIVWKLEKVLFLGVFFLFVNSLLIPSSELKLCSSSPIRFGFLGSDSSLSNIFSSFSFVSRFFWLGDKFLYLSFVVFSSFSSSLSKTCSFSYFFFSFLQNLFFFFFFSSSTPFSSLFSSFFCIFWFRPIFF